MKQDHLNGQQSNPQKITRQIEGLFHVMRLYVSNRHLAASVMPQANIIILLLAWSALLTVLTCHYMILYVDFFYSEASCPCLDAAYSMGYSTQFV